MNSFKDRVFSALAVGVILLGPSAFTAWGQASNVGAVTVTVLDSTGASVPGANLELKDLGTNDLRRAQTSAAGTYTFPSLQFGTYQLTVTAQGFQNQVFPSVQVQTGRNTSVNATLQVGITTQTVTVAASEK